MHVVILGSNLAHRSRQEEMVRKARGYHDATISFASLPLEAVQDLESRPKDTNLRVFVTCFFYTKSEYLALLEYGKPRACTTTLPVLRKRIRVRI